MRPPLLSRRRWLVRLAQGTGSLLLAVRSTDSAVAMTNNLAAAEFAYISPMQTSGDESKCHGEVWFGWLDKRIVIVTARDSWKYRALARGLDRAYLWVGDYGRWRGWFGRRNRSFERSPRRVARCCESRDSALLERLLAQFAEKYPEEFPAWEQEQRDGFLANRRTLIVYELLTA